MGAGLRRGAAYAFGYLSCSKIKDGFPVLQAADKVRVAIITKNIAFVGGAQSDCTSLNGVLKRSFRLKRVWQARYRMCFECRNLSGGLSVI
jgi:hypothetical protein